MLPVLEVVIDETEPKTAVTQPESLTPEPDQEEAQLTAEVEALWQAHGEVSLLRKHTAAELRQLKLKLGERLHAVKQLLSRPGRGGKYHAWLRERRIARSSADRLIERHLEAIGEVNAQVGAISPEDAIEKLLTFFAEKFKRVLPDHVERYQAAYRLLNKLGLQVEQADESFVVLEPEVEPDEPYDDEPGDDLFPPPGDGSDEESAMDDAEPALDSANDLPSTGWGERKRQIEL